MTQSDSSIQRLTLLLALCISSLIAVMIPGAFFLLSYQNLQNTLESETELAANGVNGIIRSNQKMWRFEEVRLSELLERPSHDNVPQTLLIRDMEDVVIAKNDLIPPDPSASHALPIYDAGSPVGQIEVYRSLRPLLQSTALVTFFSILTASFVFFIFRRVPLQSIKKAFHALKENEKKYRLLYETMKEGMALHRVALDENGTLSSLTVIDVNPSCEAMFGGNPNEIIGSDSFMLFGDTFREFLFEMLNAIENGESISFELCIPGKETYYNVQAFSPDKGLVATLFEDITESRIAEQQIQQMAYFDTLTKLPNRALFHDRINQAIALATRDKTGLAVLFIDLDHFKNINDTLGHSSGDQLLIEAAQRLNRDIRSSDTLARLGGDEFVVVITNLSEQLNATYVAQKLINSIQAPFSIKGKELHITASIGISLFPDDGIDAETLIKHADMAMYSSKGVRPQRI